MIQAAIQCKDINKTYGSNESRIEALKNIDLDIFPGELTLLVGPSGSGKTTLISIISTILSPDTGKLLLLDRDVGKMSEDEKAQFRCEHIGMVYQSLCLMPTLTVLENVALPLIIAGQEEASANEKALKLLKNVHLDHRSHVPPGILSKGQQQRVAISRAMINDSSIIVCDEPTSALDHVTGFEIMEFLHEIALKSGKVVVVVTHDPSIFPYGDRIIRMRDGQIISTEEAARLNNA
jgi:putative ABC transport system ATP-binding protein